MRRSKDDEPPSIDLDAIRREAHNLLSKSDAYDVYPTPVWQIVEGAGLRIDDALFTEQIDRLADSVEPNLIKRATGKLLGMVDIQGGMIYISPGVSFNDPSPLVLHETGHFWLPWQRDLYRLVQDSTSCLSYDLRDQFEREATRFAWELVFQVDRFQRDAERGEFSLRTPVNLAKRYGSPPYAAIRRFVETNRQSCGLLIQRRKPSHQREGGNGVRFESRLVQSESFAWRFGERPWDEIVKQAEPSIFLSDAIYGARRQFEVLDRENRQTECEAHSLSVDIHDFTFIYPAGAIKAIRS